MERIVIGCVIASFAVLMFIKAAVSLFQGSIEVGWVFERAIADRTQTPIFYWLMVISTLFAGVFMVGVLCYGLLLHD